MHYFVGTVDGTNFQRPQEPILLPPRAPHTPQVPQREAESPAIVIVQPAKNIRDAVNSAAVSTVKSFSDVLSDLEQVMPKGKESLDFGNLKIIRTKYQKLPYRVEFNTENNHSVYFIGRDGELYQHDNLHQDLMVRINNRNIAIQDTQQYKLASEFPGEYYPHELFRKDQMPDQLDNGLVIFLADKNKDSDATVRYLHFTKIGANDSKKFILNSINLYKSKLNVFK